MHLRWSRSWHGGPRTIRFPGRGSVGMQCRDTCTRKNEAHRHGYICLYYFAAFDSKGFGGFDVVWLCLTFLMAMFPSSPATHTVVADRSSLESQVLEKRPSWKDWHDASLMEMCRRPWRTRRWANQLAVGQHFATLKHGIAWPRSWQTGIYWNNMNEYFEFYIFELWVNRSLFTNITHTHTYIYIHILCIYVCFFAWNSWRASNVLSI